MKRAAILKSDFEGISFYSKRNTVFLRNGIVEKHFASAEGAAFEAAMLERLYAAGIRVPKLIAHENHMLKMSYMPGETIPDFLTRLENCPEESMLQKAADNMIQWLEDFYRAMDTEKTSEIRGDVNGRNFLWDGEQCWGLDFEEQTIGAKEQDIGRLLAFVLSYDPPDSLVKTGFADRLLQKSIDTLDANPAAVFHYRDQELIAMRSRRGIISL
jgi:serine/threonine-protein kinase RIO1